MSIAERRSENPSRRGLKILPDFCGARGQADERRTHFSAGGGARGRVEESRRTTRLPAIPHETSAVSTAVDIDDPPLLGMGCMRLSTEPDRDPDAAIAVLHAAFDAGITFFDTANAYCRDATETGHNERLLSRALATWTGDRSRIVVATKGGLTRPQGHWVEDGRARALVSSCEASRRALGVERIQLYQLHAPDPRTPLSTSVRALAELQRDGLIASVGLCNVNVGQIDEA